MKSINNVKQFIVELLKLFPEKKADYAHIGKAYYYANRFALKEYGTLVSIHRCAKLDYGPAIDNYKEIFGELREEDVIVITIVENIPYIKLKDVDAKYTDFPKEVIASIKKAFLQVKDKTFQQLIDETHELESYKKASMYGQIDYLDDIFTDEETKETCEFLDSIPRFT